MTIIKLTKHKQNWFLNCLINTGYFTIRNLILTEQIRPTPVA